MTYAHSFNARKTKHINQTDTASDHFHSPRFQATIVTPQEAIILEHMRAGHDYTLSELAHATKLEKSSVSARVNHMLYKSGVLVKGQQRKCFFTEILCRTIKLP
jgi:hypothetical protein